MSTLETTDAFSDKHGAFLSVLERAWAQYDEGEGLLEIYLVTSEALPPAWLTASLKIAVTDMNGFQIDCLELRWTDVSGSLLRAETKSFPTYVRPSHGERFAAIGDFVFYAGECELTRPNEHMFFSASGTDPKDDRIL